MRFSHRPWSWPLAAILLLAATTVPAPAQTPAVYRPTLTARDLTPRTDWYGIYLKDRKIGYARTGLTRQADGTYLEAQLTALKIVTFGQKAEVRMEQNFLYDGTAPYRLRRGEFVAQDGKLGLKKTIRLADRGYEVVHEALGVRQTQTLEGLEYGLPDALAPEVWVRTGPKKGAEIFITHLDLAEAKLKVERQTCTVQDVKQSLAGGVAVQVFEVQNDWPEKGIKSLARFTDAGVVLSDQLAAFELRLEPEAKAKDTQFSQDLFVMGLVKIDNPLGDARRVRELVIEVRGDGSAFPEGPRQSQGQSADGTKVLRIGKAHGKAAPATEAEAKENLTETAAYPISDPRVQKLARQAVGDALTPAEKVRRLVQFTHDYVKPSLSATLPQVHDLLESKKGDCKSYALLLANLGRAAGIPTREVSGLLYVGDDYQAFGGHAWNEVLLDGVWVPVDASLNQTEVDAAHVSFGSDTRAIANLLNTLGKLSFRLIEVKHGR